MRACFRALICEGACRCTRFPPSHTGYYALDQSAKPPQAWRSNEAAAALQPAAVILLIHMLLLLGERAFPALQGITAFFHCSAEVIARARALVCERRECRGGWEEGSDACTVIDFQARAPSPETSPRAARDVRSGCFWAWRELSLSLSAKSSTRQKGNKKKKHKTARTARTGIYSAGKTKPDQNVSRRIMDDWGLLWSV